MNPENVYILCVDDDETVLDSLKAELTPELEKEFLLEWAVNGPDALEVVDQMAARGREPIVVICDYIMPQMKGDEVLEQIHKRFPQTKNILLTGQATTEGIGRAVNLANLYRFFSKPWQKEDLFLTIREAIFAWRQGRQLEVQNKELHLINAHLEEKVRERTVALEEKNLHLRQRVKELSALNRIANKLSINRNLKSIVQMVCEDLLLLMESQRAMISLVSDDRIGLWLSSEIGGQSWKTENKDGGRLIKLEDQPVLAQVIDSKQPVHFSIKDISTEDENVSEFLSSRGSHAALIVPLISWSEVIGLIVLERTHFEREFNGFDLGIAETAAGQLSGALETARLLEEEKKARQEADRANRAKSQFLANMSHEIRTPMNAILGFTQILLHSDGLREEQKEHLQIIHSSGHHLLNLINDVLDMSKIEAGKFTLNRSSFDLYQLFDGIRNMFHLQALKRGLKLDIVLSPSLPRFVSTDESKLNQVLINLINNALKFTHTGGVSIRVKAGTDQGHLEFEVEDTGVGVPTNAREKIFEAFYQVTGSPDHTVEGSGLGLAICKKIIEAMGGRIRVDSQLGRGSLFIFDIWVDVVTSDGLKLPEDSRPVAGLREGSVVYKVLIADDNRNNRLLLREMFTRLGFPVKEAENGMEALDVADAWRPDLVLIDLRMPVMDGFECVRSLRSKAWTDRLVIVALTSNTLEGRQAVRGKSGCDDFVSKPFRESELYSIVQKFFGLNYVYRSPLSIDYLDSTGPLSGLLTRTAMESLPGEWKNQLKKALMEKDLTQIDELLVELPPEFSSFKAIIDKALTQYDYDQILAVL